MESAEIDPYIYNQLIFDKGAKAIQGRKYSLLTTVAGASGHAWEVGRGKEGLQPNSHTLYGN